MGHTTRLLKKRRARHANQATDSAKAFALANEVALSEVTGTGKGGRVTKRDVQNYLKSITADLPDPMEDKAVTEEE